MATVDGRIGVYSATLEIDGDIDGSITDVSFPHDAALTNVSYSDEQNRVEIDVVGMNMSGIDGTTLADVTVTGGQAGIAELRVTDLAIGDVAGGEYEPDPDDAVITVEEQPTETSISLSSFTISAGDPFTVNLTASGDSVAGYSANITYDPETVGFYRAEGSGVFDEPVTNDGRGWVMVTQSNAEGTDDPVLAELSFESSLNASGTTELQFVEGDTTLNNEQETLSIGSYQSGEITFE